jgi:hypothetical protein
MKDYYESQKADVPELYVQMVNNTTYNLWFAIYLAI